ncbi:hypothetical protein M5D96_001491 [Drosophila gunungcola]|uniref:Uncharacterized protein n=1 Tax=Drosophila gunungcola TaxID=103775 RepID=A0A9P9YY98_9MUSC|nr:hypothetical protein M5D96_001491 [Drosophila gunungcola]
MHFALRQWRCLLVAICQLWPKFARAESQTKPNKFNNCCPEKLIGWVKIKAVAAEEEVVEGVGVEEAAVAVAIKRAVVEEVEPAVEPEIKTKAATATKVEPRKDRTKRQPQAVARKEARNSIGGNSNSNSYGNIKAH